LYKPIIGDEKLQVINNDIGIRVVNFPHKIILLSKIYFCHIITFICKSGHLLVVKAKLAVYRYKEDMQLHVMCSRPWLQIMTDHNMMVAKVKERLAARIRTMHRFRMEKTNLKNFKRDKRKRTV
jgi:hypothetical protein